MHHHALFTGAAALSHERLGMIFIFDVLVAAIAARMTGDELIVEVDADPVGIGFDRHATVCVGGRNGILIGVKSNAELAGGD